MCILHTFGTKTPKITVAGVNDGRRLGKARQKTVYKTVWKRSENGPASRVELNDDILTRKNERKTVGSGNKNVVKTGAEKNIKKNGFSIFILH